MAVSTKTLTPTNQVVSIPDMTEKPNASVLSDGISKEADAINALNSNKAKYTFVENTGYTYDNANGWENVYNSLPLGFYGIIGIRFQDNYIALCLAMRYSEIYGSIIGILNDDLPPKQFVLNKGVAKLYTLTRT